MAGGSTEAVSGPGARAVAGQKRNGFYLWMSVLLALLVLAGFAPTVFLRGAFFEVPELPLYLHVHGAIVSGWFAWLLVQVSLANSGRVGLHRRLGTFGAIYAAVVVAAALVATFGFVPRTLANGISLDQDVSVFNEGAAGFTVGAFVSGVVWSNLGAALSFAVLIGLAVVYRGRSDAHKRFMLLASISLMGPALSRISRWPLLGGEEGPFTPSMIVALLAALVVHDLVTRKRIHPATLLGVTLRLTTLFGMRMVAASDFGRALIRSLA